MSNKNLIIAEDDEFIRLVTDIFKTWVMKFLWQLTLKSYGN